MLVVGSEFARVQLARELGAAPITWRCALRRGRAVARARAPRDDGALHWGPVPRCCTSAADEAAQEPAVLLECGRRRARAPRRPARHRRRRAAARLAARAAAALGVTDSVRFRGTAGGGEARPLQLAACSCYRRQWKGLASASSRRWRPGCTWSVPTAARFQILIDGEGGFICDPAEPGRFASACSSCSRAPIASEARRRRARTGRAALPLGRLRRPHAPRVRAGRRGVAPEAAVNPARRLLVRGVDAVNRRGKAVGVRLVRLTRKAPYAIHPKHLVEQPWHDWYLEHLHGRELVLDVGTSKAPTCCGRPRAAARSSASTTTACSSPPPRAPSAPPG